MSDFQTSLLMKLQQYGEHKRSCKGLTKQQNEKANVYLFVITDTFDETHLREVKEFVSRYNDELLIDGFLDSAFTFNEIESAIRTLHKG